MAYLLTHELWVGRQFHKEPGSYIPPTKYPMIRQAVLEACDAQDGVRDGVLENPRTCTFDPAVLQCTGADSASCLTAPQVAAARAVYTDFTNPRTGARLSPGYERGSEMGWGVNGGPLPFETSVSYFKYVVFGNQNWDHTTLDYDADLTRALESDKVPQIMAIDSNLSAFKKRGGKILHYMGWSDQNIPPRSAIDYYESVVTTMGGRSQTDDFLRLFMVPGMLHCQGGEHATDQFDRVSVLEQWVEQGIAPDRILAATIGPQVGPGPANALRRTRPLCPYPQIAKYIGSGSIEEAANFACTAP